MNIPTEAQEQRMKRTGGNMYTITLIPFPGTETEVQEIRVDVKAPGLIPAIEAAKTVVAETCIARDAYWSDDE